jgi:hypothetical protein
METAGTPHGMPGVASGGGAEAVHILLGCGRRLAYSGLAASARCVTRDWGMASSPCLQKHGLLALYRHAYLS